VTEIRVGPRKLTMAPKTKQGPLAFLQFQGPQIYTFITGFTLCWSRRSVHCRGVPGGWLWRRGGRRPRVVDVVRGSWSPTVRCVELTVRGLNWISGSGEIAADAGRLASSMPFAAESVDAYIFRVSANSRQILASSNYAILCGTYTRFSTSL